MIRAHARSNVAATLAITLLIVSRAMTGAVSATTAQLSFDSPVKVNTSGWGFEPTIDTDGAGTLYVTAHKASATNEAARLSSFVWYSKDDGATWNEMPSPLQVHDKLFSFEGDTATDARDRMYFVDTYGPDTWLSSWSPGPTWQRTAPAPTPSLFDDRPWLAAHGDGIVYLLTTDIGTYARPSDGPAAPPGSTAWAINPVLYRSTDHGETWSMVRAFNGATFCGLAASPLDDVTLTVVCADPRTVRGYTSSDRGAHWAEQTVFSLSVPPVPMLSVAYDDVGNTYSAFIDAAAAGNKLYVARTTGSGWTVQEITPFAGAFREVWTTARGNRSVGIGFYATPDTAPNAGSEWHVYGGVTTDGTADVPSWSIVQADPHRVITGAFAPPDFMQCVMAPDGTLYLAYSRESAADVVHALPPNFDHDIYVARQSSDPAGQ